MESPSSAASPLLRRASPRDVDGRLNGITPVSAGWAYLGLSVHELADGGRIELAADRRERLVVILEGTASVTAGAIDIGAIGSRASVFDGPPPPVVLVEPGLPVAVEGAGQAGALVAIADAPGGDVRRTACIDPAAILAEERGSGRSARRVHHLRPPDAEAGRLIVFETFTPAGNWSSWPPHKHDTDDPPHESRLEELYLYRFARPQGFALQRVYTADGTLDETVTARDLDVVLVPRGYHPVAAAPADECYYLSVMAGPTRAWQVTIDPDHATQEAPR
jgi:5-deoxy-glucuronate isomerase